MRRQKTPMVPVTRRRALLRDFGLVNRLVATGLVIKIRVVISLPLHLGVFGGPNVGLCPNICGECVE